jgi:hypothetical protein
MKIENQTNTEVPQQHLRSFGLLMGGVFTLIGLWPLVIRQEGIRLWAIVLASLFALGALLQPGWLRPLYTGWMKVGHILGFVNTRIILSLGFFLVFTPIGLIRRMLGKDSLNRRFESQRSTYRDQRQARLGEHMKKQY